MEIVQETEKPEIPEKASSNYTPALHFKKEWGIEISDVEIQREVQRDARRLLIEFEGAGDSLPTSFDEIKILHSDIIHVLHPEILHPSQRKKPPIEYVYVEFANEAVCTAAKSDLEAAKFKETRLVVDFVGEKSTLQKTEPRQPINWVLKCDHRLRLEGLVKNGISPEDLRELFPKSMQASITKGYYNPEGYVNFRNRDDAMAAFYSAQDLEIKGIPVTVLFAQLTHKEKIRDEKVQNRFRKLEELEMMKIKKEEFVKRKAERQLEREQSNYYAPAKIRARHLAQIERELEKYEPPKKRSRMMMTMSQIDIINNNAKIKAETIEDEEMG